MYPDYEVPPKLKNCQHCGDPAVIFEDRKEAHWPFRIILRLAFCYECCQEVKYGKLPRLTDSPYQSRRGSGMQKRKRHFGP
jgi:hypothetical protein